MNLSQVAEWYYTLAHKWPNVFDDYHLACYWSWSRKLADTDHRLFVSHLRAGALKLLRASVAGCKACPLHQHRMAGRPVLDDCSYSNDPFTGPEFNDSHMPLGATSAEIMLISEGPGQFEQRTGNPFVTYQVLAGSTCAQQCGEFENCYSPKSQLPQQPCKPASLTKLLTVEEVAATRLRRAEATPFPIMTVAGFLDNALHRAGLWREGWNNRQTLLGATSEKGKPRPGTVYLSNMVKCRSCKPKNNGGWEDEAPSKEYMDTCTMWLEMQVHVVQPKVVVALGNPAIIGTTGITDAKVLSMRGNVYPGKFGLPVLAEVHPSFIPRQGNAEAQEPLIQHLVSTLETAKKIADGTVTPAWMQKNTSVLLENDFPSPDDMDFTSTFGDE